MGDRGVLGRQPIKDGAAMLTLTVTLVNQCSERVMGHEVSIHRVSFASLAVEWDLPASSFWRTY